MSLKGLERAIQNLNSLSRLMVPTATAQALNRVAGRTITQGSRKVAARWRKRQRLVITAKKGCR